MLLHYSAILCLLKFLKKIIFSEVSGDSIFFFEKNELFGFFFCMSKILIFFSIYRFYKKFLTRRTLSVFSIFFNKLRKKRFFKELWHFSFFAIFFWSIFFSRGQNFFSENCIFPCILASYLKFNDKHVLVPFRTHRLFINKNLEK